MKEKEYQFLDPKLFQVLLVYYLVAYIIDFTGTLLIYNQNGESTIQVGDLVLQYLILFVSKLTYVIVSLWLTRNSFKKATLHFAIIPVHLALAALLSFYTAFIGLIVETELLSGPATLTAESVYIRGLGGLSFNFFMYFSMIAIVYAYHYFHRKKTNDLRTSKLKAELLDSKIRALQAQLNPHFLFNALNDIASLIDENKIKAQNAIADLSQLLRKTLRLKNSKLVTLKEELLLLDTYVNMEKLRYDDKWELIQSIPAAFDNSLVPPLLFQPFLENTIKHGFSEQHQRIRTVVQIEGSADFLELTIQNNGKPLQSESPILGNGIGNILERLDSLFEGDFEFNLTNESIKNDHFDGPVVCMKIRMPRLSKD